MKFFTWAYWHLLWWRLRHRTVIDGEKLAFVNRWTGKEVGGRIVHQMLIDSCVSEGWKITNQTPTQTTLKKPGANTVTLTMTPAASPTT